MLSRKDLFKDTLRKAAHAWKRIVELRLTGPKSTYGLPTKDLYSIEPYFYIQQPKLMFYCLLLWIDRGGSKSAEAIRRSAWLC